jgi:hypothetical protein
VDDEAEHVAAAYERTIAATIARVEVCFDATWAMPARSRRRQGGLLGPAISVVSRSLLKHVSQKFAHLRAEGVLDLQRRRYMLDYGGYVRLGTDGKEWAGLPGAAISSHSAEEPSSPTPLWLIDVLAGVTAATTVGNDIVRGTPCTHLRVTVDLGRASKLTPGAVAVPSVDRFEDVLALPIEVWVDDQHIRRVRFSQEMRIDTLELWDVGSPLEGLDWTRPQPFPST